MLRISSPLRKVSRGHSSCHLGAKGQRNGRSSYRVIESGESQMFTNLKLAKYPLRVKPSMVWQRDNQSCRTRTGETGSMREGLPAYYLNHFNRPVRTRMPGGVGGVQPVMAAPYPDLFGAEYHAILLERTHGQSWNRWRHGLFGCRTPGPAAAACASGTSTGPPTGCQAGRAVRRPDIWP